LLHSSLHAAKKFCLLEILDRFEQADFDYNAGDYRRQQDRLSRQQYAFFMQQTG
jgi:hypothetical protein